MNCLILGDVHLGKSLQIAKTTVGASLNSRIIDQLNLLDWCLDYASEHTIQHIIITGDVFEDPKPPPSLITFFISWLKKCYAHNVNVHIIAGNHDILRSGYVYSSPLDIISEVELDNVSVYKDISTIFIGTTAFTFMPFRDRKSFSLNSNAAALQVLKDSLTYELASIPLTYTKVVVGHLALEGSIFIGDEIDDLVNELFCPIDMFTGYDYVWMGHVHKPQIMNKQNPHVAHVGSMDVSNFGETDHKKYVIIFNCDSIDNNFYTENLPTRSLKKINIVVPKDVENTTEYVLQEIKKSDNLDKSIVRVEVSLASPELQSVSKSAIEKYLTSNGVFNVAGISESKKITVIKKDTNNNIDTKMDVPAAINTYATTYIDDNLRENFSELAMEIYSTYKLEAKE